MPANTLQFILLEISTQVCTHVVMQTYASVSGIMLQSQVLRLAGVHTVAQLGRVLVFDVTSYTRSRHVSPDVVHADRHADDQRQAANNSPVSTLRTDTWRT